VVIETLSIKVSKAEKNLLRQCARRNRSSASALLRDALRNVLQSPQASQASLLAQHGHLLEKLDRDPASLVALLNKYEDVPMSLADASIVRLSELHPDAKVWTLDADFKIYRRLAAG